MNIVESFTEIGNNAVDQLANVQSSILEWNRQVAASIVPHVPAAPGADALGGGDVVPRLVDASFALTGKVLEANRAFATGFLAAWAPTTPSAG